LGRLELFRLKLSENILLNAKENSCSFSGY
jgi:hypothetical protein